MIIIIITMIIIIIVIMIIIMIVIIIIIIIIIIFKNSNNNNNDNNHKNNNKNNNSNEKSRNKNDWNDSNSVSNIYKINNHKNIFHNRLYSLVSYPLPYTKLLNLTQNHGFFIGTKNTKIFHIRSLQRSVKADRVFIKCSVFICKKKQNKVRAKN